MLQLTKVVVKQLTPPILLSIKRAMFARQRQTQENANQRALKANHETLNQNARENEICLRANVVVKLHPESRHAFEAFCFLYPEMVVEMNRFIELTLDKQHLLDVGALHGIFSLVFSSTDPAKESIAVDASPIAFARLLYNVHKNRLSNVTPVECALSAESGVIRMHYEWEHAVVAGTGVNESSGVSVEKRTGDELCASLGFEPDVIKIDVEGHEVKVFKGLREIINRCRPLIFLEVHPSRIRQEGDRLENLTQILSEFGYRAELTGGEAVDIQAITKFSTDLRLVIFPSKTQSNGCGGT